LSHSFIFFPFLCSHRPICSYILPSRFVLVDIAPILSQCPPSPPPSSLLHWHHHLLLSISLSRLRLRGLNSPTTLTLLQASVGSTCIETMPPAFVECMQASIPILLLCVQIFSLCDLPLFSIQLDRYSQRRSYFLAVTSHPCSGTVVRIFAESLRIVVRTLPSSPSCFLSLINTIPTLRSQSNLHPRGAT